MEYHNVLSAEATENRVIETLISTLGLDTGSDLTINTPLLGNLPEFDSQSVITVLTALEDEFDILIEDDEIEAALFETIGTLSQYVEAKLQEAS